MSVFEGSYLGDNNKISDDSCLERKICHYVYKPEEGDDYWQVQANTPFSQLPEHWRCPNCDAAQKQFMIINRTDL